MKSTRFMLSVVVLIGHSLPAWAASLALSDALSPDHSVVTNNCTAFKHLYQIDDHAPNDDTAHAAGTNIEVWCSPEISPRLSKDLTEPASQVLFNAISTWSTAMVMGNPNGLANLGAMQNWYIENYNSKWALTPVARGGYIIGPTTLVERALIGSGELSPIIDSSKVPENVKKRLQEKMKELNDFRGSFNSPNGAAGR
jgi:hypothetical protein